MFKFRPWRGYMLMHRLQLLPAMAGTRIMGLEAYLGSRNLASYQYFQRWTMKKISNHTRVSGTPEAGPFRNVCFHLRK